jgi:hypothetical protein
MSHFAIIVLLALAPLTANAEAHHARRVVRRPTTPVAAVYSPVLVQMLKKFAAESRNELFRRKSDQ